ncbi:BioY family (plasmid) [Legionella adelaidensis]|uniref:BioY family n=1 Tax=Legionella adelaidensis TaxID=45056 RepID=A0A0W0R3V5_9GAMM|nr:biotin transporter BioY [Legionella adelaidensis]KTC65752.1 BioY family protein [Legionella adelaidensis]VEH85082.1 BioY family [Legionella adelaidensis]
MDLTIKNQKRIDHWKILLTLTVGICFMTLMAKIRLIIPTTSIQLSLQSLSVSMLIIFLGKKAYWIVLAYLFLATLGVPLLADGSITPTWILSPKAGYYVGFLFSSLIVPQLLAKVQPRTFSQIWCCLALNETVILCSGFLVLSYHFGFFQAWLLGVWPYILGALGKITVATSIYKIYSYSG